MTPLQKYMLYNITALILLLGATQITATIDWNITYCNDGICYNPLEPGGTQNITGTGTTNHITIWDSPSTITDSSIIENTTGIHTSTNITMHYNGATPAYLILDAPPDTTGQSCGLIYDSSATKNSIPLILESKTTPSNVLQMNSKSSSTGICQGIPSCNTRCSSKYPICSSPCLLVSTGCLIGQKKCLGYCSNLYTQGTCESAGCT